MNFANLTQNQAFVKNAMRWQRNKRTPVQTGRAKLADERQAPRWAIPLKAGLPQGWLK